MDSISSLREAAQYMAHLLPGSPVQPSRSLMDIAEREIIQCRVNQSDESEDSDDNNDSLLCADCGCVIDSEDNQNTDGNYICLDCAESYVACCECGEEIYGATWPEHVRDARAMTAKEQEHEKHT